jgi:hypothetical protein
MQTLKLVALAVLILVLLLAAAPFMPQSANIP